MQTFTENAEWQGFKELSILPSTYPKGAKILQHLLPVVSWTSWEVSSSVPSLNARELIWRSTHPGDGEGLIGIMPSGQSITDIESSVACLAFLDAPKYFSPLGITEDVRRSLLSTFYFPYHSDQRDVWLSGMTEKLNHSLPEAVRDITEHFSRNIRWIATPFISWDNITITEHPNLDWGFRVDSMWHIGYQSLLHYNHQWHMWETKIDDPILVMPDGTFLSKDGREVPESSDRHKTIIATQELISAVRDSGVYPQDQCLQIECGIAKNDPWKAHLFQVRLIGPRHAVPSRWEAKDYMWKWQFWPQIEDLEKIEVQSGWDINDYRGVTWELWDAELTLGNSTIYPHGYPPAYVPIWGVNVICQPSQISFGHGLVRWLNWAARGGEKGPGTFEQFDKVDYEHKKKQLKNIKAWNTGASVKSQLMSIPLPDDSDFLRLSQSRHSKKPLAPREEPTPKEEALISRHAPLFEEKEILPYEVCMKLLGEVFELCNTIPVSYFWDSYGGSQLELHKYTPRKQLVSDEDWRKSHNYDRPYYAIDYDRPEFTDEESVRITFSNNHIVSPKIYFYWGGLSLEIDLRGWLIGFSSDNWFILNDWWCMTGTIVYGYCPKDANWTRSIAHAQHVFWKECQKTHEYYQYKNPPYEPIWIRKSIIRTLFWEPERPPFTWERYESHATETLQNASDLLWPILLRMKDALNITLQTDPRTFLRYHLLWRTDLDAFQARKSKSE